jgi:hypothetical protein
VQGGDLIATDPPVIVRARASLSRRTIAGGNVLGVTDDGLVLLRPD